MGDSLQGLDQIRSRVELGKALRDRVGGRSLRALEDDLGRQERRDREALAAGRLRGSPATSAGRTTLSEIFNGSRLPSMDLLQSILRLEKVNSDELRQWMEIWRRCSEAGPSSNLIVAQADPRLLGVHRAISLDGVTGSVPEYVSRDTDLTGAGLRSTVVEAARNGGFVLLVGESSVGKTRSAYEAIKQVVPGWKIFSPVPRSSDLRDFAADPVGHTVLWLDELQRYLSVHDGLSSDIVQALLQSVEPVIIIGTMWPARYISYTAPAWGDSETDERNLSDERALLEMAHVVPIGRSWSDSELARARAIAASDGRIREAINLATDSLSPSQVLAAAPQLLERWRHADVYSSAVLSAAIDATRLGYSAPLPAELLQLAAPGYCDERARATAPIDWFSAALNYSTERLHGAASALEIIAGDQMGEVVGYSVADYLLQSAVEERVGVVPPASLWEALIENVNSPDDTRRLTVSSANRLYISLAARFAIDGRRNLHDYQRLPHWVNVLLEPRLRSETRETSAGAQSSSELGVHSERRNASLIAKKGDLDSAIIILSRLAARDDKLSAYQLAGILARLNDFDAAVTLLLPYVADGDLQATAQVAKIYVRQKRYDEAISTLESDTSGNPMLKVQLAKVLVGVGRESEAVQLLDELADSGHSGAGQVISKALARFDAHALARRASDGDFEAMKALANIREAEGDLVGAEELLKQVYSVGNPSVVARRIGTLLYRQGRLAEAVEILSPLVKGGDKDASRQLAAILAKMEDVETLSELADAGDRHSSKHLNRLYAKRDDVESLTARANSGDSRASRTLAAVLARRGDFVTLRARADSGDRRAARRLAKHLAVREPEESKRLLRRFSDRGDRDAAMQLVTLLVTTGDDEGLSEEVRKGTEHAAQAWLELLAVKEPRRAELLRQNGLVPPATVDRLKGYQFDTQRLVRFDGKRTSVDSGND